MIKSNISNTNAHDCIRRKRTASKKRHVVILYQDFWIYTSKIASNLHSINTQTRVHDKKKEKKHYVLSFINI